MESDSDLNLFFEERKKEVEEYFLFLDKLNIDNASSFVFTLNESENFQLSDSQIKIFKGNCFMMLYNLIEGVVSKSLQYIFDTINDKGIEYRLLITELIRVWLKYPDRHKSSNELFNLDLQKFSQENQGYFYSGNIDAKLIREALTKKIGFDFDKQEPKLRHIKECRNAIAHGEKSFSEIAQDKTLSKLTEYKHSTFEYLQEFISCVEKYISDENYLT